ncbi:anthranilate synthase component I family protein [Parvularcula marina]|uniref:anthranilate synthase component I family protein n=1 Tax=Parvularcula marina TaxID=2292771 RepID=UPI0035121070
MPTITFHDAAQTGGALFGPGFTGAGWTACVQPAGALTVPFGEVGPGLFDEIATFCAEIPEGGAIGGYIGYEAAASLMPELGLPEGPDGLPVVHLVRYGQMRPFEPALDAAADVPDLTSLTSPDEQDFVPKVQAVIDEVLRGEIFQANISRRLSATLPASEDLGARFFSRMMARGAAPYAAYLPCPGGAVLSNSPELFLEINDGHIAAEPVKGTAPRSGDPVTDKYHADALLASEKDRAENIMIADLLRNDLAKVCRDHSITEPAICALRSLPAVHHLYSRIEGELREGCGSIAALAAAFPCGSVTGAPKHRAMQVISRFEGEGRGPYCGTVLFMPHQGAHVFSVAIRTAALSVAGGTARLDYRTGGGITALSDPQAEYQETVDKAYGFEAMVR